MAGAGRVGTLLAISGNTGDHETGIAIDEVGRVQTQLGQDKFTALLRGCCERGINWFDCADIYGSHSFVNNALTGLWS